MTQHSKNGEGVERARARRDAKDASGAMYVDGSIYEGMEACLVRSGKTVAHVVKYADAVEIAEAVQSLAREPATADVGREVKLAEKLLAEAVSHIEVALVYQPDQTASDWLDRTASDRKRLAALSRAAPSSERAIAEGERESAKDRAITALRAYVESAGVPITEFDPEFVIRMMGAMMVSFHKYGRVADAYPLKFDAASDVRARMKKYRETGNRHYLVDAANFAMIEAMHPGRASEWAGNDAADSPGRTTASGHRLVQETNAGDPIRGETILHVPGDEA